MKRARSRWEATLEQQLRILGLRPEVEQRFCERLWRLDFSFPLERVACEVEGGIWSNGRHNRGAGFQGDVDKYNRLALMGWLLIRATPATVRSGEAARLVEQALKARRVA